METGQILPSMNMLYRLSEALEVSLDYLIGQAPDAEAEPQEPAIIDDSLIDSALVGARIKQLRGFEPRSSFAKKFDIANNTVFRYESGESYPSMCMLVKLCSYYKVTLNWLIFGTENPPQNQNNTGDGLKLDQIWDALVSLSEDDFFALWSRYCDHKPSMKDWVRIELMKRFPEFIEWYQNTR
jgi:transcriptional regulator with XRE-family HTH domain